MILQYALFVSSQRCYILNRTLEIGTGQLIINIMKYKARIKQFKLKVRKKYFRNYSKRTVSFSTPNGSTWEFIALENIKKDTYGWTRQVYRGLENYAKTTHYKI